MKKAEKKNNKKWKNCEQINKVKEEKVYTLLGCCSWGIVSDTYVQKKMKKNKKKITCICDCSM